MSHRRRDGCSTTSPRGSALWRRLSCYVDPLAVHRSNPRRYPFLLESTAHGTQRARYDILFAFPGPRLRLGSDGRLESDARRLEGTDFLRNLDAWFTEERVAAPPPERSPFHGGWFLYLGYELVSQTEPTVPVAASRLPVAEAHRVPAAIVRDHVSGDTVVVAEPSHAACLDAMERDLRQAASEAVDRAGAEAPRGGACPRGLVEDPPEAYLDGVERIKRYIREGDVFQVNLSRAWHGALTPGVDAAHVYERLRRANPAPFAGLAVFEGHAVASSSPERLVAMRDGRVDTRPIAGTYPRHVERDADRALSRALLAHPKERAEHIMLIDLERNDLGRVCEIGSVEVSELMVLESYAHVHHIVSNVRGRLRAGVAPGEVVRAVFPGGTITGCPKVRCMEIIAELEGAVRGPYTGSFGYLNRDGSADLNILIRTLALRGEDVEVRAGAGIVADSVASRELEETRQKARGPLGALAGLLR